MELNLSSLDIIGFKDQPVPNTYITHSTPANHLGIILPGYRFSADMPALHYSRRVLLEQGADVLSVDYAYYRTNFMMQEDSEQDQWMSSDVFAASNAGLSQRPYEKVTLVGKSIGTIALGLLLADSRFQQSACVWLTPLLTSERLCSQIEKVRPRSLFVIGTADRYYKPDVLKHLEDITDGHALVLEGVEHGLEIPGDIPKSLSVLNQITQTVQEFLGERS
ncbi:MAG TPA: hypothetical protein VJ785_03660 [Anaerolineales bacterium]|nr:hypothetical protein [Anaerolineales bacterium]